VLDYIAAGVGLLDGDGESSGKVYMDTHRLLIECPVVPVGSSICLAICDVRNMKASCVLPGHFATTFVNLPEIEKYRKFIHVDKKIK
jgi:hypothetical protein